MKRSLPFLILLSALEIFCIVLFGKWLWDKRYINTSEVTIVSDIEKSDHSHDICFIFNNEEYKTNMTLNKYNVIYTKDHRIRYSNSDTHGGLIFLFVFIVTIYSMYFTLRTIDFFACYDSTYDIGERFRPRFSIFPNVYVEFFNYIDSINIPFTGAYWYKFWGY